MPHPQSDSNSTVVTSSDLSPDPSVVVVIAPQCHPASASTYEKCDLQTGQVSSRQQGKGCGFYTRRTENSSRTIIYTNPRLLFHLQITHSEVSESREREEEFPCVDVIGQCSREDRAEHTESRGGVRDDLIFPNECK